MLWQNNGVTYERGGVMIMITEIDKDGQLLWRAPSGKEYALPKSCAFCTEMVDVLKQLNLEGQWSTKNMIMRELSID